MPLILLFVKFVKNIVFENSITYRDFLSFHSSFFWLLALLLSSILWYAVPPLKDELAFGLVFSVIFQEVFRLLFYIVLR